MGRNVKYIIFSVGLISIFSLSAGVYAGDVVLTEEIVTRFEATHPAMWPLTLELDKAGKIRNPEEKERKTQELLAKREEVLKANGWADLWEYMDASSRIMKAYINLKVMGKFSDRDEETQKKVAAAVKEQLQDYSEDEIQILMKHFPKLQEVYIKSGQIPGK